MLHFFYFVVSLSRPNENTWIQKYSTYQQRSTSSSSSIQYVILKSSIHGTWQNTTQHPYERKPRKNAEVRAAIYIPPPWVITLDERISGLLRSSSDVSESFLSNRSHKTLESDSSKIFSNQTRVMIWSSQSGVTRTASHWCVSLSQCWDKRNFTFFLWLFYAMKWCPTCYKMTPDSLENGAQCCCSKFDCRLFTSKFCQFAFYLSLLLSVISTSLAQTVTRLQKWYGAPFVKILYLTDLAQKLLSLAEIAISACRDVICGRDNISACRDIISGRDSYLCMQR